MALAPDFEAIGADYSTAIEAGSYADAAAVVKHALAVGVTGPQVFARVLTPAMYRIGERWERAEITVADEHLATAISNRIMGLVYEALAVEMPTSKERVVITAVEGDQHVMGLQMIADVLEGAGYQTMYLGADTPIDGLIASIARHEPMVVALGGTAPWSGPVIAETVRAIRAANPTLPIVLGGAQAESAAAQVADDLIFLAPDAETVVEVVAAAAARGRRQPVG